MPEYIAAAEAICIIEDSRNGENTNQNINISNLNDNDVDYLKDMIERDNR